jgi:hypothetical protein
MEEIMKIPALFNKTAVACVASGVALLAAPMVCIAGDAPLSHAAEPGMYMTLTKGQTLKIDPDGKVTAVKMDMGAKMQEAMKKQAQPATKGLRVWFDQNGQLSYLTDPDAVSGAVSGAPMDKANK